MNWIASLGPNVDSFEKVLSDYCGVKYAAALSSGTSAIHLALILLGVKAGDEVIVSSFTFSATVNPIVYQGAVPVLIDSEPGTWNMDPELLEKAITERGRKKKDKKIKAIILAHLYGMPARMKEIMEIAGKYEIPVIEDAAEALGSRYEGKALGSFGDMGVLSFNGNKIITTSGGGALLSDDESFIKDARFLATQARDQAPHYQHSRIGYNYRMSNVLAGIGLGQMEVIDEWVNKRRENNSFYRNSLHCFEGISLLTEPGNAFFSNHWLTAVLFDPVKSGTTSQNVRNELEKDNIESRPLWKPMHLQPVFKHCPAYINGVSEGLFDTGLCLPSGSNLRDEDRERVIQKIVSCIGR